VQRLADALVKLVALQPIQFYCLRAGEYVHAARDHAVDLLLGCAAEVGSECRRPTCGTTAGRQAKKSFFS
jgi:hypothetical protein